MFLIEARNGKKNQDAFFSFSGKVVQPPRLKIFKLYCYGKNGPLES